MTPKTNNIRDHQLMTAVRELPCQHCGNATPGQVHGAHANWSWAGKGLGIKAHDLVAALCFACHAEIDYGGIMTKVERERAWLIAFFGTMVELRRRDMMRFEAK